jgi:hypothetical protein
MVDKNPGLVHNNAGKAEEMLGLKTGDDSLSQILPFIALVRVKLAWLPHRLFWVAR